VCRLNQKERSTTVTLSLGAVALITRDVALIASEYPMALPKNALEAITSQVDVLIKAKVHREYCWDNWILRPDYVEERINHLVSSGFGLVVSRLSEGAQPVEDVQEGYHGQQDKALRNPRQAVRGIHIPNPSLDN